MYKPSMRIEGACASGGLAVCAAIDALKASSADLVMVVGVEEQTSADSRCCLLFFTLHHRLLAQKFELELQASYSGSVEQGILAQNCDLNRKQHSRENVFSRRQTL